MCILNECILFACVCVCVNVCGPSHEYSVSSAAAVTMTELMTVTDVEIVPHNPPSHACVSVCTIRHEHQYTSNKLHS